MAIFCHIRPDGDTLGSALALSLALNNLGIKAQVFCDDVVPPRFFFLNSAKSVKNALDREYQTLIAIDCADGGRLGCFYDYFVSHKNTYSIDHHISNTRYAKINYVFDSASNCENVLSLLEQMQVEINQETANLLLMGMMTDTGNFRHKNVKSETLFSASKMVEKGADINLIHYHMFTKQSKERACLFGLTMSKIRYFLDGKFGVATVSQQDLAKSGAKQDETEGFIDFLMGVDTIEVGACVLEMAPNKFKVSFRSKGTDVNAVANVFGGGGHLLASGCQIQGEYEEVVDKICYAVKQNIAE